MVPSMKMSKANLPKPTEGELELLRVLWAKGPSTVRELHDAVSQERALGYTTVLKLLQIMTEKGLVQRTEVGRAHLYRATASQEETSRVRQASWLYFAVHSEAGAAAYFRCPG